MFTILVLCPFEVNMSTTCQSSCSSWWQCTILISYSYSFSQTQLPFKIQSLVSHYLLFHLTSPTVTNPPTYLYCSWSADSTINDQILLSYFSRNLLINQRIEIFEECLTLLLCTSTIYNILCRLHNSHIILYVSITVLCHIHESCKA